MPHLCLFNLFLILCLTSTLNYVDKPALFHFNPLQPVVRLTDIYPFQMYTDVGDRGGGGGTGGEGLGVLHKHEPG